MSSDETIRPCPGCKSADVEVLASMSASQIIESSPYYSADDYVRLSVSPDSHYPIVRCRSCKLVYSGCQPSSKFLVALYTSNGPVDESVKVFSRPSRLAQVLKVYAALLDQYSRLLSTDTGVPERRIRILDYGCSFGAGLLALSFHGYPYEVTGVEMNRTARDYLSRNRVNAVSDLNELNASERFDIIILNDVLEHVPEPGKLLVDLNSVADTSALMYINVPDFSEWRLKIILSQIENEQIVEKDMNPWEHLTYFSPSTLNEMAEKSGWHRLESREYQYGFKRLGNIFDQGKGLLRLLRDWYRYQTGTLPDNYLTSGIFVKSSSQGGE